MPRPLRIGPTGRFRSPMPCGFSTLITVAPISPSIIAASGPVIAWPASITTMPSSGPVPVELALAGAGDPIGFKSLWIRASRRWERIAEHHRELRCATCHNWRRNAEPTSTGRRQGVSVAPAALPCACRQAGGRIFIHYTWSLLLGREERVFNLGSAHSSAGVQTCLVG